MINQLELIEEVLEPLRGDVENCLEDASVKSVRTGVAFSSIMLAQFLAVQYGTYVAFSWDIMEPITCSMTLFDAILVYYFWLMTGKPWDVDGLRSHFYERMLRKRLKQLNVDYHVYTQLKLCKTEIINKLKQF